MLDTDAYGLELARAASLKSKDPSTQVGCCLMRTDGTIASLGRNGAPRGVDDEYWLHGPRERKLAVTIHAEINAVVNAHGADLEGATAYIWPLAVCCHCASALAQVGVKRIVSPPPIDRWSDSCEVGRQLLESLGVEVVWMER